MVWCASAFAAARATRARLVLLAAVAIDVKWMKNRYKVSARVYVSPTYFAPAAAVRRRGRALVTPYELNDGCSDAGAIGLGQVDGPEDVILDGTTTSIAEAGTATSSVSSAPDHKRHEVYRAYRRQPLGMRFRPRRRAARLRRRHGPLQGDARPARS